MKRMLLISLMILTIITSCKKENGPVSKETTKKTTDQLLTDSLTVLRNEFGLEHVDVIPTGAIKIDFTSVADAKQFLTDMGKSEVELGNTKPRVSSNSEQSIDYIPKLTKTNDFVSSGSHSYSLDIPNATLIIGNKRINLYGGFNISGSIDGDGVFGVGCCRYQFSRFRSDNVTVDMYGFTFARTWTTSYATFRQLLSGSGDAQISFSGSMSFVLVVKEIGEVYRRTYSGLAIASFGPYAKDTFNNGNNMPYLKFARLY